VCLYALQDYIGEEKVNQALSEYAKDWKYADQIIPKALSNNLRFIIVSQKGNTRFLEISDY
jgi:hypothetical protein